MKSPIICEMHSYFILVTVVYVLNINYYDLWNHSLTIYYHNIIEKKSRELTISQVRCDNIL